MTFINVRFVCILVVNENFTLLFFQPFKYGFESLMANEFRDLNGTCANVIPHGPTYTNISIENKVCAVVGAIPGETHVQGARFIKLSLGYTYSHLWRVSRCLPLNAVPAIELPS